MHKRRELRKKRSEPEGSENYKEVNNDIKRCMKKAKEKWIGEQCSEMEQNPRKNNGKRAYQLVKDLTTVKQAKATTATDLSGICLTEEREILNRWTEYCFYCLIDQCWQIYLNLPNFNSSSMHMQGDIDDPNALCSAVTIGTCSGKTD